MATVHEFPDSMERAWCVIQDELRVALHSADATDEETSHTLDALKDAYLYSANPRTFKIDPGDREAAVREISDYVFVLTYKLLIRLATLEVRLFRLRDSR